MISLQTNAKWISKKVSQEDADTDWGQYQATLVEKPVQYSVAGTSTSTQLDIYGTAVPGEEIAVVGTGGSKVLGILGSLTSSVPASGINTATYASLSKSVSAQETDPYGLAFSQDGTKMYIVGNNNKTVYQYTLSTAWNVSTATYSGLSKSVSAQDVNPFAVAFSQDGTKMYIVGYTNKTVYQYTLSTAWNVSTATYSNLSFSVSAQETNPYGIAFNQDGTKMYVVGDVHDTVYQYTLSTAWNVSTATYSGLSFSVSAQEVGPRGLAFSQDGTKMYIVGYTNKTVYQYTCNINDKNSYNITSLGMTEAPSKVFKNPSDLYVAFESSAERVRCQSKLMDFISGTTTGAITKSISNNILKTGDSVELITSANNINGASYASLSKSVSAQDTNPYGLAFSPDGTKMYVMGSTNETVYQYNLSIAWNVSTATYASLSFLVSAQDPSPVGLTFSPDGTKMYIVGINDTVYQYTLSTAWNVSTADYSGLSISVSAQDSSPYGIAFSSDGTKMYVMGNTTDTVYQYTLSTPWNVSTATYASLSKSVSAQDGNPFGLAFNQDGTKMFIAGAATGTVYQYTLSTAWNVSTATYSNLSKLVSAQDSYPAGLAFSPDGTKMYVVGKTNKTVYQYTCNINGVNPVRTVTVSESTVPGSGIDTATYASLSKSVSAQDSQPARIAFSPDGTKMYIVGGANKTVYQYTLSTAWNVSTATYASLSKSVSAQDTSPFAVAFSQDGTKMYILGYNNKTVYQYTLSTAWNVSTATYSGLSKSVSAQDADPFAVAFSQDGTKMYVMGYTNKTVFQYTLSTAWNVSTATYASLSKSVSAQDTSPSGIAFSSDGTKMYVVGFATGTVYQYNCNINQTVTYTSTFDAIPSTPHGVLLQDLSVKQTKSTFTESGGTLTITHTPVVKNARALQYKVVGDTGNEVTQVQTDLWKLI